MNALLTLPVALPLAGAAAALLLRRIRGVQRLLGLGVPAACATLGAVLVGVTMGGTTPAVSIGGWPQGLAIVFAADPLTGLMLTITGFLTVVAVVFAVARGEDDDPSFHPLVLTLVAGVFGSLLTADLFNLFVWFEVMLIASYVLLTLRGGEAQVRAGAVYVTTNLLASTVLLIGVGLLYGVVGTVNLGELAGVAATEPAAALAAAVVVVAVAVKAALVPVHGWLPRAYPHASPAVAALFSGLLTKVGVYVLFRLYSVVFAGDPAWQPLLLGAAVATMVVGVLGAVGQDGMRGILSFHMISQIGYLILPLGMWSVAGVAAGIFYLLQYVVVKAALFLAAGVVETTRGTGELARLGGVVRTQPVLATAFMVAALSLAGIPPLSGFVAKFLLIDAAFREGAWIGGGAAVVVSLFTLLSMVKIWNGVFWGDAPARDRAMPERVPVPAGGAGDAPPPGSAGASDSEPEPAAAVEEPGAPTGFRRALLVAPAVVLATVTAALGPGAQPVIDLSTAAAEALLEPSAWIAAVAGA